MMPNRRTNRARTADQSNGWLPWSKCRKWIDNQFTVNIHGNYRANLLKIISFGAACAVLGGGTSIYMDGGWKIEDGGSSDFESLFCKMAPILFPVDDTSHKLSLPDSVDTIIIDVGARESHYLAALEGMKADKTTALILFDPLPASFYPLAQRVHAFSDFLSDGAVNGTINNRAFAIRAAMGEEEEVVSFKLNHSPACGSLMESANSGFWCAETIGTIAVQVFRLESVINLLEDGVYKAIHIKIDAEGADFKVILGAGKAIRRADTVIVECQDVPKGDKSLHRIGQATCGEITEYMCSEHQFCDSSMDVQGGHRNVLFSKKDHQVHLSEVLKGGQFSRQYKALAETGNAKSD